MNVEDATTENTSPALSLEQSCFSVTHHRMSAPSGRPVSPITVIPALVSPDFDVSLNRHVREPDQSNGHLVCLPHPEDPVATSHSMPIAVSNPL
ncbi:MAG: hypothetical protein AAFR42_12035, partial [Cyanobacteria bacterium J06628_6]